MTLETAAAAPAVLPSWDLSDYYSAPDDVRLEADLARALTAAQEYEKKYRGQVAGLDAAALAGAMREMEELFDALYRPLTYANLLHSADGRPPEHGKLKARCQEQAAEIDRLILFFGLEWIAVDDARAEALMADAALADYVHYLRRERVRKPHILSEPEEKILSQTTLAGRQAWNRMFHELVDYVEFLLEGETEKRRFADVMQLLQGSDREMRRRAANAVTEGFRSLERPLTHLFNTLLLDKKVSDEMRHFAGPADSRNLSNEVDAASLDALLAACERYHPMVARYYRVKGRLLGIDELFDYDRYAPLGDTDRTYEYDEARGIVLDAFANFSPDFAAVAAKFFERDWIDVPTRLGKRQGAFCSGGVPTVHSYVLLNYTGKASDVKTLAHELGHGVHFELSGEKLSLFNVHPTLCLAETASVFAERVVFDRLLTKETDPRERLALLCNELEQSFATVFRQVGFTRFEMAAHTARRTEGELSFERLCDLWMESGQPMFGDALQLREQYRHWWLYIPHFIHTPFYCYAYAYGKLLTLALYGAYREEGDGFVAKYLELLSRGGSASPDELLAPLGVDTRDPAFWARGLDMLDAMVTEAEALAAKVAP